MLPQNYSTRVGDLEEVRGLCEDCGLGKGLAGSWGVASGKGELELDREAAVESGMAPEGR